ncbi:MAG: hypothetical protein VYC98_15320 [Planctomycetota bacterium]|nr:hypothetical protein [Planctomycetota bacterium]
MKINSWIFYGIVCLSMPSLSARLPATEQDETVGAKKEAPSEFKAYRGA